MVLERLFAWIDRVLGSAPAGSRPAAPPARAGRAAVSAPTGRTGVPPWRTGAPHERAALLSVDGGGQVLLVGADRITLGHVRAGRADLGFLADVGPLHAELLRSDSLQAGPGWRIAPLAGEHVAVDGHAVGPEGARIAGGSRVRLGNNLELVVRQPDAASASLVLELLRGAECAGARQLVLLARGSGGRVRIGAARAHAVRVPNLELELALEWSGDALALTGDLPLSTAGEPDARRAPRTVPFPPPARVDFTCGRAHGSRPPFALSLEPVPREPR